MPNKLGLSQNNLVADKASVNYGKGKKRPQYIAALSVCLGSVAAGAVLGWTANISEELKGGKFNGIPIDEKSLGWIGSFTTLGAMIMCFPIGMLCDWLGRKLTNLLLVIPFSVGWIIIIFARNVEMIYAGRFVTGMAGGAFCVSAPLYTSEIAQKEIRGALGSYFQLLLTVGILFAYVAATFASNVRDYTVMCAILPIIFGVVFFLQPETPVYRLKQGRESEARTALVRLRGDAYDVDAELETMKAALEVEARNTSTVLESLRKPNVRRAFIISFGLMFFQQMSGVNAVIFYTGAIFESANVSLESSTATILVGIMQVAATLVSSLIVDKLGRKILLIGSDLFMAISGIALGVFFMLKDRNLVDESTISALGILPVISLCVFIVVFSLGFGPIPWMISAEVYAQEVKSVASSAAGTFSWLLAFLVTKFYLDLKNALGGDVTFYIFSAISVIGTVFVITVVPETKGKEFDQIQKELGALESCSGNRIGIDNPSFSK